MEDRKSHILIVDDDDKILKLLERFFQKHEFLVSTAIDASKAEFLLSQHDYDLIILDVMMPKVTGLEFARSIQSNKTLIPIVMLTALSDASDKEKGIEAGANEYITKPFEPQELLDRVKKLIISHKQNKKVQNIRYFGDCIYDLTSRKLINGVDTIELSLAQASILELLTLNAGYYVTEQHIINETNLSAEIVQECIVFLQNNIDIHYLKAVEGKYVLYT